MKGFLGFIAVIIAVITLVVLCGCAAQKYNVDYCGQKDLFQGAKDSYPAGKHVKLVYDMIATDTDYSFYVDDKEVNPEYKNDSYVIEFIMPDHDITVYSRSVNSMYVPMQADA